MGCMAPCQFCTHTPHPEPLSPARRRIRGENGLTCAPASFAHLLTPDPSPQRGEGGRKPTPSTEPCMRLSRPLRCRPIRARVLERHLRAFPLALCVVLEFGVILRQLDHRVVALVHVQVKPVALDALFAHAD